MGWAVYLVLSTFWAIFRYFNGMGCLLVLDVCFLNGLDCPSNFIHVLGHFKYFSWDGLLLGLDVYFIMGWAVYLVLGFLKCFMGWAVYWAFM